MERGHILDGFQLAFGGFQIIEYFFFVFLPRSAGRLRCIAHFAAFPLHDGKAVIYLFVKKGGEWHADVSPMSIIFCTRENYKSTEINVLIIDHIIRL
jgi:hypothetical protein